MRHALIALSAYALLASPAIAASPPAMTIITPTPIMRHTMTPRAGMIPLGGAIVTAADVLHGWSTQRSILGKSVQNNRGQTLGKINDIIVSHHNFVSFAIIGVGGFLGINQRQVAIPMSKLQQHNGRWILPGATKEALQALPPFVYAR